jgi:hypothetical protein
MNNAMTRSQVSNRITRCIREAAVLAQDNARGQNDQRIAYLATTRIAAVKQLREIKLGR